MFLPKRILLTGASGDIGSALATSYAANGVTLALTGRDRAKLTSVGENCQSLGAKVLVEPIDVTDHDRLREWVIAIDQAHPIDLIVANAGITGSIGANGQIESWEDTKKILDTNLYGVLSAVHPLIERMRERRQGQIGLMSSLSGYHGLPITPAYCGSKAAIKVYGEALRGLLAADGVGVSVICPGFVKSAMSDRFPGPKPFMIAPQQAAGMIKAGLANDRARISFPFPMNLGMWFLSTIPPVLSDRLISLFGYDSALDSKD
ncbi:MAG: SDR family NAD(P)-dependent oxidoreductase [Gammaproteobacteria bacterium]|nr:SDR family NAD(P)-dependent oxidoreductase [Gammaproteobacteria bacterium]